MGSGRKSRPARPPGRSFHGVRERGRPRGQAQEQQGPLRVGLVSNKESVPRGDPERRGRARELQTTQQQALAPCSLDHESPPTPGGLKHVITVSHSSGSWQVLTRKQWLGPESFRTLAHTGVLCLKLAVSWDHSRHRWPARLHVASVWLGLPHAMATGFPGRACQENWAELCHLF